MFLSSESLREAELQLREALVAQLKNTADENSSAGDFCLHFINSITSLLGTGASLSRERQDSIRTLCELVEERPFPALVWARLIPRFLNDVPFLACAVEQVLADKRALKRDIGGVIAAHASEIGLHRDARVLIQGYSGTIPAILAELQREARVPSKLFVMQQNRRGVNEGTLLQSDLLKHQINVTVLEDHVALGMLRDGAFSTLVTGSKAIGLWKNQLSVINTFSEQLPTTAREANTKVLVIGGRYKFWPHDLYGEYATRVAASKAEKRFDAVIGQEMIDWIGTEGGAFQPVDCRGAYAEYLTATIDTYPGWSPEHHRNDAPTVRLRPVSRIKVAGPAMADVIRENRE